MTFESLGLKFGANTMEKETQPVKTIRFLLYTLNTESTVDSKLFFEALEIVQWYSEAYKESPKEAIDRIINEMMKRRNHIQSKIESKKSKDYGLNFFQFQSKIESKESKDYGLNFFQFHKYRMFLEHFASLETKTKNETP